MLMFEADCNRDDVELRLSERQLKHFDSWKHAAEALAPPTWYSNIAHRPGPTMYRAVTVPMDLVQDATTDCSVVASLCAGAARAEKGHPKLLSNVIYPWDPGHEGPAISPNGKYVIKLNFNGCYRKVLVDDRLPVSMTKRLLHVIDRKNPSLLWPALLEKAYLKVRGGYDFPGSNSATDLWVMTGWIPEQVIVEHAETDMDSVWEKMFHAWNAGDVLVTLGTGLLSPQAERQLGLAAHHDYAVLDVVDDCDYKFVLLKNPWADGQSWTGQLPKIPLPLFANDESGRQRAHSPWSSGEELSPGTFWMQWSDVEQNFECIYLNWNPSMFGYREDIHFSWDLLANRSAEGSFANNPQFSISTQGKGKVWLLLCRHFQDTMGGGEKEATSQAQSGGTKSYINLYAFENEGEEVLLTSEPSQLTKGSYVDSHQILLRTEVDQPKTFTVVVSEQNVSLH